MKKIFLILVAFILASCAHYHTDAPEHHHHAYEKRCAYSVMKGDLATTGKDEYKIEHGGKIYYFASKKNRDEFKAHLSENIERANSNWINKAKSGK